MHYHPVAFGSRTLTPSKQNYHSSKLEFLALKWSVTEHFKEYLGYAPFTVHTNNNPLTYVLTTPNLDVMGHCWVGALASYDSPWSIRKDQTMPPWCHHVPAYVEEVQKHFKEAYAEAQHQSNSKADRQKCTYDKSMSTVQLMPEDIVLKKADAFQGKRKVKDHWSKVEYKVICQVTNVCPHMRSRTQAVM